MRTNKYKKSGHGRCPSGKFRLRDKRQAVDALHLIRNKAQWQVRDFGRTDRHEVRTYSCDRCNGYHLTSQPAAFQDSRVAA